MIREQRRFWLWASAALLAGLLLRLWFIVRFADIDGDALIYGAIAKNLILHGVYGFTEPGAAPASLALRSTLIRLPGYPLFLAACFRLFGMENYQAVLYLQAAADLFTCWLAAALARRLFGPRAFLPVLWLAALCPFTANYTATPLTETFVLTTIALAFYAFVRWQRAGADNNRWLWLLAAALSCSILLRPEQGLLAAAIIPAMLWAALAMPERRASVLRSVAPVLAAAVFLLLPLVPWTARNWATFHVFQPLAPRSASDPGEPHPGGFNRWYRTWALEFASTDEVYWNYGTNRIDLADIPTRAFALGCTGSKGVARESEPLYPRTAALLDAYDQRTVTTPANDAGFGELAGERIHAARLCYYAGLPIARVLDMMFRPRVEMMPIPDEWWESPASIRLIAFAYAALNLAGFVFAFAGLNAWRRRKWAGGREIAFAMAATLILRTALLLTLDNSEPRYTLEFFPVLFVWAGALFAEPAHPAESLSDWCYKGEE